MRLLFVPVFMIMAGCGGSAPAADPGSPADPAAASAEHEPGAAQADGHGHGQGEPMPMLAIMRQLSVNMAAFTHALWLEDFPRMSESSAAIAHHAPIDRADVRRMQAILGDEWQGFEEADDEVH
jgi:hypothetical protein